MTIDEAIAILAAKKKDDVQRRAMMSADACQLGIEALERVKDARRPDPLYPDTPLLGETED